MKAFTKLLLVSCLTISSSVFACDLKDGACIITTTSSARTYQNFNDSYLDYPSQKNLDQAPYVKPNKFCYIGDLEKVCEVMEKDVATLKAHLDYDEDDYAILKSCRITNTDWKRTNVQVIYDLSDKNRGQIFSNVKRNIKKCEDTLVSLP